jgi:hypothetical protein
MLWCVDRKRRIGNGRAVSVGVRGGRRVQEGDPDAIMWRCVDGELVVAASKVLHERVPSRDVRR